MAVCACFVAWRKFVFSNLQPTTSHCGPVSGRLLSGSVIALGLLLPAGSIVVYGAEVRH